jgi:hypothetical protein
LISMNWKRILKGSPIEWLLEVANPSVRYFTLREILDKADDEPQVLETKKTIADSFLARKILQKQRPEGYWEDFNSPYHPKYKSSYWTLMLISQLGMDRNDERIRKACEFIFDLQQPDGAFSSYTPERGREQHERARKKGKKLPSLHEFEDSLKHEHEYSCLTGNVAAALIRLGYGDDTRVKKALEWLVKVQNKDGGWLCPYWRAHVRDKHGCFFGTICPMEAFSVADTTLLTNQMKKTIENGAEFLLMHRLYEADHHGYRPIKKQWLTLSFPLFLGYSILRGLDVITRLGYAKDERLSDALDVLLQKRQHNGTWIVENSHTGRMQANLEPVAKPSKWVTLVALRILKRLGSESQSRI